MSAGVGSQYYSAFNPLDIGGCALWLDATDQSTLTLSGTNVTQWNDKSGNGRNMTASGTITNTGSINGLTAANWASNAYFYGSASNTGTTVTVFAVFNMTSSTSSVAARVVSLGVSGTADYNNVSYAAPILRRGGTIVGAYRNGTELSRNTNATDQAVLMCSLFNGSTNTIYTNGTASSSVASTGNFNYTQHRIGSSTEIDSGSYFRGTIGEVIIYNDALSDTNRQIVEGYLSRKWFRVGFTNILVPIGPFVPTSISSCQLWLDAADTSSLTLSGSNVTAWNDKSGTSRTVTFSGTSTYNSTNKTVSTSSSSFFYANVDSRKTTVPNLNVFIVYKWQGSGLGTNQSLWGSDVGGGWNRGQLFTFPADTTYAYGLTYTGVSPNTVAVSGLNNSNQLLYNATYSYGVTNATGVYVNGIAASSFVTEAAASGQTSTTNTYFGTLNGSSHIAPLDVYEVLIYNDSLTTTQRRQVEGYLTMKWGIQPSITGVSSTHPYYSIVPLTRQFAPVDVPGCALWLDAADPNSMTLSGSNVTQWRDKSGNGCNATSLAGATAATYSSNSFNTSYPSLYFNVSKYSGSYPTNTGTTLTGFFVGNLPTTNTNFSRVISLSRSGVVDYNDSSVTAMLVVATSGVNRFRTERTPLGTNYSSPTIAQPNIITVLFDGTNCLFYANGSLVATNASTGSFNISSYAIGAGVQDNGQLTGNIAEVILFNAALTTSQRQQVEGYLAKKWGLVGSTSTIVPFTPTQISGCALWLDAADSTTVTGTNPITNWSDKSGTGKTVTFVNTNTYTNGVSVNTSGSSSAFFKVNVDFRKSITPYVNMFIVHTWSGSGLNTQQALWGQDDGGGFNRIQFLSVPIDANASYGLYYGNSSPYTLRAPTLNTGSRLLYSVNLAYLISSSTFISVNGNNTSSVTEAVASPQTTTQSVGFASQNTTGGSIGTLNFHEIIIYTSTTSNITAAQRQQVEGYLANKWGLSSSLPSTHPYARTGLPSTHPFISRNPRITVFNPRQVSGCQLWYDGADSSTITLSSGKVSRWANKGSNGSQNDLIQATVLNQPTYTSNIGVVFSSASSTTLSSSTVPSATVATNSYCVFTPNNSTRMRMFKFFGGSNIGSVLDTTIPAMFLSNSAYFYNAFSITPSKRYVMSQNVYSASSRGFSLNFSETTSLSTDTAAGSSSTLVVGGESTVYYDGIVHEIITFDGYITTSQRQQVEGYLAWKWGLTGGYTPSLAPFTPTQISGCQLWLDATDQNTMTLSGSNITQWNDKSGNGRNVTASGTITNTGSINGVPATNWASNAYFSGSASNTGSTVSVFCILNMNSSTTGTNGRVVSLGTIGSDDFDKVGTAIPILRRTGTIIGAFRNYGELSRSSNITDIPLLAGSIFTGSSNIFYANGTASAAVASSGNFTYANHVIGTNSITTDTTGYFRGTIGEVIIYNAALTDVQRQQVEGYLAQKWGLQGSLPSTHPYASRTLPTTHPYKMIKP